MNTKIFWKLRTLLLKIVFSIRKFIFSLGCYCDDEKKNSSFFKQIMKTIGLIGGMECGDIGFEAGITYAVISICLALILTK